MRKSVRSTILQTPMAVEDSRHTEGLPHAREEAEVETDADAKVERDAHTDAKVETDADAKVERDAHTDAKVETDADAKVETDADAKVEKDAKIMVSTRNANFPGLQSSLAITSSRTPFSSMDNHATENSMVMVETRCLPYPIC